MSTYKFIYSLQGVRNVCSTDCAHGGGYCRKGNLTTHSSQKTDCKKCICKKHHFKKRFRFFFKMFIKP